MSAAWCSYHLWKLVVHFLHPMSKLWQHLVDRIGPSRTKDWTDHLAAIISGSIQLGSENLQSLRPSRRIVKIMVYSKPLLLQNVVVVESYTSRTGTATSDIVQKWNFFGNLLIKRVLWANREHSDQSASRKLKRRVFVT